MLYPGSSGRPGSAALIVALALSGCDAPPAPTSACEEFRPRVCEAASEPVDRSVAEHLPAPEPARGESLGAFRFTMYYVAQEDDVSGQPDTPLYSAKDCTPIATVSKQFAKTIEIQGTGKLADGRVLNTSGRCACPSSPCFTQIQNVWAMGANGKLSPFRSVAVDPKKIKLGSTLYIPELDGKRMPGKPPWGGYVHDGCVVADDNGGGIKNHEIDLFVAKKAYSNALDHRHRMNQVTVYAGQGWCEKRNGRVFRTGSI